MSDTLIATRHIQLRSRNGAGEGYVSVNRGQKLDPKKVNETDLKEAVKLGRLVQHVEAEELLGNKAAEGMVWTFDPQKLVGKSVSVLQNLADERAKKHGLASTTFTAQDEAIQFMSQEFEAAVKAGLIKA